MMAEAAMQGEKLCVKPLRVLHLRQNYTNTAVTSVSCNTDVLIYVKGESVSFVSKLPTN